MITALNSRFALMSFQSPITYCLGIKSCHIKARLTIIIIIIIVINDDYSKIIIILLLVVVLVVVVVAVVVNKITDKFGCIIVWSTKIDLNQVNCKG